MKNISKGTKSFIMVLLTAFFAYPIMNFVTNLLTNLNASVWVNNITIIIIILLIAFISKTVNVNYITYVICSLAFWAFGVSVMIPFIGFALFVGIFFIPGILKDWRL